MLYFYVMSFDMVISFLKKLCEMIVAKLSIKIKRVKKKKENNSMINNTINFNT